MIEIARVTAGGLARLTAEWEALWQRDPMATPFQSPAWLLAWWRFFGTSEPLVLTARAESRLVGLLPLYFLREGVNRKLLPIGIGLSDYIDALADPMEPAVPDLFMTAIAETRGWDECWLPDLAGDGALARAASPCGLEDQTEPAAPCPVLSLSRGSIGLCGVIPRKTMRDVHQARARSAKVGEIVVAAAGEDRLDAAMDDLFLLHARRWRACGENGLCGDPCVRAFHRAAAAALLHSGMLRLYQLWIGDALRGVYYGFVAKRTAYAYLGGFDPAALRQSPGAQILAHAIAEAAAEGASTFDFLRGGEGYKYGWGARDRAKVSRRLRRRCRS